MSETPRTNQAMADVIGAGGTISLEHKSLVVLCRTLEAEVADRDVLRKALVGLVGVDGREELDLTETILRAAPAPDSDKTVAINAIDALRQTLPVSR